MIECRLPDPESGSLSEPGPNQGSLKERPLASLMRYCEEYVLTCRLEVWRGQDRAAISYRRGEIIGTIVGGSEGSERLPEVLGWSDGSYEIILSAPVLPQMISRGRDGAGARPERKRHTTIPMMPGSEARSEGQGGGRTDVGAKSPGVAPLPRPGTAQPMAVPPGVPRVSSPSTTPRPAAQPPQQARQPVPAPARAASVQPALAAQKTATRQPAPATATPRPIAPTPRPVAVTFAAPLQPEMTAQGTPPIPAVPLVPARVPQSASRPALQGVPLLSAKVAAPTAQPVPQPVRKPIPLSAQSAPQANPPAAQPAPPVVAKPAPPAAQPAPQAAVKPAPPAAQPAPQAAAKPAPPAAQPAPQAAAKPAPPAPQPAPQAAAKPAPPAQAVAASPVAPVAAQPPDEHASQTEKPQAAPVRPPRPSPAPASSNDLMPTSGTIEAKPKHASYLPPTTAPIQIADEPQVASVEQPSTPVVVSGRPPKPRRPRVASRKGLSEHPVRAYVFVGLAIGAGIVLAYWAYWYLPFGHH